MYGNSLAVVSSQQGMHPRLLDQARRHRQHPWQPPLPAHAERSFALVAPLLEAAPLRLLDCGVGSGESALGWARARPEALVIAIDQSAHRLRGRLAGGADVAVEGNLVWWRTDAPLAWLQLARAGLRFAAQRWLYPNPWPKGDHLARRWYGHPAFVHALALGGDFELRANWQLYALEMQAVLAVHGVDAQIGAFVPDPPITAFERKFHASGHTLWRLCCPFEGAALATIGAR